MHCGWDGNYNCVLLGCLVLPFSYNTLRLLKVTGPIGSWLISNYLTTVRFGGSSIGVLFCIWLAFLVSLLPIRGVFRLKFLEQTCTWIMVASVGVYIFNPLAWCW